MHFSSFDSLISALKTVFSSNHVIYVYFDFGCDKVVFMQLCMTCPLFCLVMGFAALVPLEELREINFTKQYGIARDPEVIDILDTASRTKGVFMMFLIVLFSSAVTTI